MTTECTIRRSRTTKILWQSISNSFSSEEMSSTPTPRLGDLGQDGVDLLLGADIDAARRLVADQQARRAQEGASDQQLLLVAAAQLPRRRV